MTRLIALSSCRDSIYIIRSPAVGSFTPAAKAGALLSGGAAIGTIRVLNSTFELVLPGGVRGCLLLEATSDRILAVEYGQELFRLDPAGIGFSPPEPGAAPDRAETEKAETGYMIAASTSGIFYRKSAPGNPPYVQEGQTVEKGKILGLIEIMKVFNHIVFPGTDTFAAGTVRKIYCEDAQEVKLGQPLFLIDLREQGG